MIESLLMAIATTGISIALLLNFDKVFALLSKSTDALVDQVKKTKSFLKHVERAHKQYQKSLNKNYRFNPL